MERINMCSSSVYSRAYGILMLCLMLALSSQPNAYAQERRLGKKHGIDPRFPDFPHLDAGLPHVYPIPPPAPMPMPMPMPMPQPVPLPEEVEIEETGPPEYVKDEIVVTTDAEYECSEGFMMQGDECIQFDQRKTKLGCREGWKFSGGVCLGVEVAPGGVSCQKDYTLDPDTRTCVKMVRAPNQIYCPKGFKMGSDKCVRDIHTAPEKICPDDYTFVGMECFKKTESPYISECPEGFILSHNLCKRKTIAVGNPRCHRGQYLTEDGLCASEETARTNINCPLGFSLDKGTCTQRTTAHALATCQTGATLNGSDCLREFKAPAKPSCPEGFSISPMKNTVECLRAITANAEAFCHKGFFNASTGRCGGKKHEETPQLRCPIGFNSNGKEGCIKTEKVRARMTCPYDYRFERLSKSCSGFKKEPPSYSCPEGGFVPIPGTSTCSKKEVAPPKKGCDAGYRYNPGSDTCSRTLRQAPSIICPDGYTNSVDDKCLKIEVFKPEQVCEAGATLRSKTDDAMHVKRVCVRENRKPVTSVCPARYKLVSREAVNFGPPHGEFHEPHLVDKCIGQEFAEPKIECPKRFTRDSEGRCVRTETKAPHDVCPQGFEVRSGQCVKALDEKPVVMCPVGYKLYGGTCVNQINSKPKAKCPGGYKYDALVGKCYRVQTKYNFKKPVPKELILDDEVEEEPKEEILDLEQPREDFPEPPAPQPPFVLPQQQMRPPPIQVVQQPVPIPAPVVYLPRQGTAVQQPPQPSPPVPYPVPVPYAVEKTVEVERPVPFAVKIPVPVHHHPAPEQTGGHKKKKLGGGGGGGLFHKFK